MIRYFSMLQFLGHGYDILAFAQADPEKSGKRGYRCRSRPRTARFDHPYDRIQRIIKEMDLSGIGGRHLAFPLILHLFFTISSISFFILSAID